VQVSSGPTLYLLANPNPAGRSAAYLYQRRDEMEFEIRDLKVTLDKENPRAKSVEMFQICSSRRCTPR
jgi:hypothetical protein